MNLQNYLSAKSNKNKSMDSLDQSELNHDFTNNSMDYTRLPSTPKLSGKNPGQIKEEEDYSSGADFWQSARLSEFENRKQTVAFTPNISISRTPDNSVAELLRKIKVNTTENMNYSDNSSPSNQNFKSESFETLKEESVITLPSSKLEILDAISNCIESKYKDLIDVIKHEIACLQPLKITQNREADDATLQNNYQLMRNDLEILKDMILAIRDDVNIKTLETSITTFDRPTKNLISSIQEIIIMVSKTQEHEFAHINQRIVQLEKRILKPEKNDAILTSVGELEKKIGSLQHEWSSKFEKLENLVKNENRQRPVPPSNSDGINNRNFSMLLKELKDMQIRWSEDQKVSQDRMSQFMDMFSILQTAHGNLLEQIQAQAKNQKKLEGRFEMIEAQMKLDRQDWLKLNNEILESMKFIRETIVSYLPLNLESKILSIESLLKQK